MRYYIDTNIFLYLCSDKSLLSKDVAAICKDYSNILYLSSESIREIVLLMQNKKINTKWKKVKDIFSSADELNISVKYLKKEHYCTFLDILPVKNHKDPADRMIISQSITEKIPLISSDTEFVLYEKYGLQLIFNKK